MQVTSIGYLLVGNRTRYQAHIIIQVYFHTVPNSRGNNIYTNNVIHLTPYILNLLLQLNYWMEDHQTIDFGRGYNMGLQIHDTK